MDPLIQTPAQEAAESAADKMAADIVADNAEIARLLSECLHAIFRNGKPDLFQCVGYAWEDMLDMLTDITPTPDAKAAHDFAIEWGNRT